MKITDLRHPDSGFQFAATQTTSITSLSVHFYVKLPELKPVVEAKAR